MEKIRVNTSYNEWNNTQYCRDFSIVASLPDVGDEYAGYIVKRIDEVQIDINQGNIYMANYDYYHIYAEDVDGADYGTLDEFVAIEKAEPIWE